MNRCWLFALMLTFIVCLLQTGIHTGSEKKRPGRPPRKLQPGEILAVDSELTEKDRKDTGFGGNYAKWYPVKLTEGQTYQIDLSGVSLGYLRLEDAKHKAIAADTGSAGFSRPRIIHQAKRSDTHWIVCTSQHRRPETGPFTLIVKEVTSDPKELAKPIELKLDKGQASVDSELEMRGPRYKKDLPCKFLTVPFEADVSYQIDMSSREFLSYVFLEDPDGKLLAENHIKSGDAKPASITFKAEKAGTYRIIAAQYDVRTGGPQFSLSVKELKAKQ
jgi:hypothetical protein